MSWLRRMKFSLLISFVTLVSLCIIMTGVPDSTSDVYADTDPVVDVTDITLNETSVTLLPQDSLTLYATVSPNDATDKSVGWTTDVSGIVSLEKDGSSCTITAQKAGTVKVTAKAGDETATCTVTVSTITITLERSTVLMVVGDRMDFEVKVTPDSAYNELSVESDLDVASWSLHNETIYAHSAGTTSMVFEVRGIEETCSVEVLGGYSDSYEGTTHGYVNIDIVEKDGVWVSGRTEYIVEVDTGKTITGTMVAYANPEAVNDDGTLTSAASAYLKKCLLVVDAKPDWVPLRVEIIDDVASSFTIGKDLMKSLSELGASLEVSSDNCGVGLDPASVKGLGNSEWYFTIKEVQNTTTIDDAKVFEIAMKSGSSAISNVKGEATIMVPYSNGSNPDPLGISMFSIAADGTIDPLDTSYDAIKGLVSASMGSWVKVGVSSTDIGDDASGTSMLSYVALAVIVIISALCIVLCYRFLRM